MFDALSERLGAALGDLRRRGRLDEESVSRALREIRLALLEADVNLEVVRSFTARVRERALGEEVLKSLTPAQHVVKVVHEELTGLLGGETADVDLGGRILLAGLQGSGKTTAAAKLARLLRAQGRRPGLVAADLQRPAAIDQLEQLGGQLGVPVYRTDTADPVEAAARGLERARADGLDAVIVDTAGRLQIDEELMAELERVRDTVRPDVTVLVLDAMTGQEAVNVATAFERRIDFDGVLLTKLDGDARGGAALSVKSVTGKPILLGSAGEKLDALEVFHPDRMASRILGMGDVLTLIERAEQAASAGEQAELEKRLRQGRFTFDDFLQTQRMLRRMGPLQGLLKLMPGMGELASANVDERRLRRVEAIVLSMTPHERAVPHAIDGRRRERIARGSGTTVAEVSQLLEARKLMERVMKQVGQGKLPSLPGLPGAGGALPGAPGQTRHPGSKKKKAKRKARRR
ncbi:MAG TPA: signal recognition particle protein [Gaiellaceae bacterium]|nr:signal recognition particle protein [Gaiellaceae bacterium]